MAYQFSNTETYELIPEGDYEVVLATAEIKKTNDGSRQYISCKFTIRTDVEGQTNGGRSIFDNIWGDKEKTGQFDNRKLQKLLLSQGPNGRYSFDTDEELVQHINGLNMLVHISKKDADEYHDEAYNEIKYCSYKPSKAQPKTLGTAKPAGVVEPSYDFTESDLPF